MFEYIHKFTVNVKTDFKCGCWLLLNQQFWLQLTFFMFLLCTGMLGTFKHVVAIII